MYKLLGLIIIVAFIAGCGHNVKPEVVTEYVDRPVYCAHMPERKDYATNSVSKNADIYTKVEALVIERDQRENVETELRSIIKGCAKPNNVEQDE